MHDVNPYQSPVNDPQHLVIAPQSRSRKRWAMTGLIVGAAMPVAIGAYRLHGDWAYSASLPPGTARCGMSALGTIMIIFVIGPIFGLIGAACGWITSGVLCRATDTGQRTGSPSQSHLNL